MDLTTTYLGFKLPHPFMPGASPLVDDLDDVKRLEDAGASAIVMHSLFEEQIAREQLATFIHTDRHGESFAEALSFFPNPDRFALGPEEYLQHIMRIKGTVSCPVIASLNGTTVGGWLGYAKAIEQAGADALELNVYAVQADFQESAQDVEDRTVEMVTAVKRAVRIPVAVKLSPFYTSLGHFARRLDAAGADGLVLFNRFYQPDIDVRELTAMRSLPLSSSLELPLRLRWLALLSNKVRPSLAVTGGVHSSLDAIKAVMAGAHAVQMVSALLQRGPRYLAAVRERRRVDGRARVRLARPDAGQHEPRDVPGPERLRARQLHAHAAELVARGPDGIAVSRKEVGKMSSMNEIRSEPDVLLTRSEVARILGVSPTTVTRWAREGRLPCRLTLGGHHRYSSSVIEEIRAKMSLRNSAPSVSKTSSASRR